MDMTERSGFLWCDAWILLATALTRRAGSSSLAAIIGAADAVQHAIVTREELSGAFARLQRAGYLEPDAAGIRLTSAGEALVTEAGQAAAHLHKHQEVLEQILGATPWSPAYQPQQADEGVECQLSAEEYDDAVRRYLSSFGRRRKLP